MNQGTFSVRSIMDAFHEQMKCLYDAEETSSILCILFEDFLGWSRLKLHMDPSAEIGPENSARFMAALGRLSQGCPVQYITGKSDFNGLQLIVNPSVLIPRPETAELAMYIVRMTTPLAGNSFSALDIGTGSGCLAIYLKTHLPGILMSGTDISEDALALARSNASACGVGVDFYRSDILQAGDVPVKRKLNLVVSNPPYVTMKEKAAMRRNVMDYEPHVALFVPDDDPLKYYKAITEYSLRNLEEEGVLWFEINEAYGKELSELLDASGFSDVSLLQDFHGRDRFIKAGFRSR